MIFRVGMLQFRKALVSPRTIVVAVVIGLYLYSIVSPVRDMSIETGYDATPMAMAFFSSDSIIQMVLMAGAVALFSEAPFRDRTYPYIAIRCGRAQWAVGNVVYIIGMSLIYVIFIFIMSVVPLIPHLSLKAEWGKIWGTLAMTDAPQRYGVQFAISNGIRQYYSAGEALLKTLVLEWGCTAVIGLFVYIGNRLSGAQLGTWLGAGLALLDLTIYNILSNNIITFSPVSLAMLINMNHSRFGITFLYALGFYAAGICIMTGVILFIECIGSIHPLNRLHVR